MRVLCLVLASDTDPLYIRFQQRWRRLLNAHPDVTCYFYKGHPNLVSESFIEGDTVWVRAPETLDAVYDKTLAAFSAVLPMLESYNYVFRSNLSTLVSFTDLLAFCETLPPTNCCAGFAGGIPPADERLHAIPKKLTFPAGNGFLLSPDVVRRLVKERPRRVIQDDVSIGVALQVWGIPIRPFARFGIVSGHWICDNHHLLPNGHPGYKPLPIAFTYRFRSDDRERDLRMMDKVLQELYPISQTPQTDSKMFQRLAFWATKGMNPSVIYDVGANIGGWTRSIRSVFPRARVEEFEANPKHARPGLHRVLLGESERVVPFYTSTVDKDDTGASIYREATRHFQGDSCRVLECPMVPLDTYRAKANLPAPDFVKLDVQGAELDVLRGATECLKTTSYLLLEVSLHRWNAGAPMIEEVIRFLDERGFYMIDIVETHTYQGYTLQIDCLFAKASTGMRREGFVEG